MTKTSTTLESSPSGVVQAQTSLPPDKVKVSLDATAYVVEEGDTVQVTVTLAEAPQEGPVYIRFTLTPENGGHPVRIPGMVVVIVRQPAVRPPGKQPTGSKSEPTTTR